MQLPAQAEEANKELLELLVEFLPRRYPDRFSLVGNCFVNHAMQQEWDLSDPSLDALEVASLNVQVGACSPRPVTTLPVAVGWAARLAPGWGAAQPAWGTWWRETGQAPRAPCPGGSPGCPVRRRTCASCRRTRRACCAL